MYLNMHTEEVNTILLREKDLPENIGKKGIHLRSEIARRLLKEADKETEEAVKKAIEFEFDAAQKKHQHLLQATESDPEMQEK